MNPNLTIRTEATLQETKFVDLATIYNEFATELGIKPIKKFRDKPTGIKRIIDIQAEYSEIRPKQAKPKATVSKSAAKSEKSTRSGGERKPTNSFSMNVCGSRIVYDISTTLVTVVKTTDKPDSMVGMLIRAIEDSLEPTVEEVAKYVVNNYERPKSVKEVDRSFAIRKIKRAVQKGYLKLELV